ncbi:MAG TPA: amidohydrolase, partial [Anaerolineaceae bacterium]|nr:amidohydrolase [Anaerolineaceae bacterium]
HGEPYNVRARLTLIGQTRERRYQHEVVLSRSRYFAPAQQSLRFYREYFKPAAELEIEKERLRFLINYKETEFFINLDTVHEPALGHFLEIKSRTWSRRDAEAKSQLVVELIEQLGADPDKTISRDYVEMIKEMWA